MSLPASAHGQTFAPPRIEDPRLPPPSGPHRGGVRRRRLLPHRRRGLTRRPGRPAAGLLFRGRIAEDFELSTGTFVTVGTLRPRLLSASQGLLTDAVICGQDADCVTAMVWLHPDSVARLDDDGVPDDGLRAQLVATMRRLAADGGGSSQCVERLLVLREPARMDAGEITDKGYVNQRAVRDGRPGLVALLRADPAPAQVVVRG